MKQYQDLLRHVMNHGVNKSDRTGTGTRSVFGERMEFDLTGNKIPLLTTKKVFYKGIIHELIWMLSGDTNIRYLKQNNVSIWDSWIDESTAEYDHAGNLIAGDLPNIYQKQWRRWEDTRIVADKYADVMSYIQRGYSVYGIFENSEGKQWVMKREIDQISNLIERLKTNPDCRRLIVSAWNVAEIDEMALAPCHTLFQFYTRELHNDERRSLYHDKYGYNPLTDDDINTAGIPERALSCQLYQRSCDLPLGNPFNIVQYSILTHMIAHCVGMVAEEFIWVGGDNHYYKNQLDGVVEQLSRVPYNNCATLKLNADIKNIFDFKFEDIEVCNYHSHDKITFPSAAI